MLHLPRRVSCTICKHGRPQGQGSRNPRIRSNESSHEKMSLEKGGSVWFLKVVEVNWKLRPVNWKGQLPGWKFLKWKRNLGVIHNGYPNRSCETKSLHNTMAPWGPPTESTRLPTTSFSCNQNITWPQVNEKEPNAVGIDLFRLLLINTELTVVFLFSVLDFFARSQNFFEARDTYWLINVPTLSLL